MSEQRNATTKTIKIPGPALGTHVYSALEYAKDGTSWDGGLVLEHAVAVGGRQPASYEHLGVGMGKRIRLPRCPCCLRKRDVKTE
jgi:hypothetical protein